MFTQASLSEAFVVRYGFSYFLCEILQVVLQLSVCNLILHSVRKLKRTGPTDGLPSFYFYFRGTREITRLDIMAYLDPAFNPGSKPQRLGVTSCKSSTSDKLQTFRTIFGISCKFLAKNYLNDRTLFVLEGNLMQEKSQNLSGK